MKCGLLGRKLGHSYSPQIHSYLGNYPYSLYETEPSDLEDFLKNGSFTGINVTIPYKKDVIPYLDELSPRAKMLQAVNTIVKRSDGKLWGHNTDFFGFSYLLKTTGLCVSGKKVLVLGSGGASNTAVAVLQEKGAQVVVISRNGENHYGNLYLHEDASVIVNATPVGMYPNTESSPINLTQFPQLEYVIDVIYNPSRTQLLLDAERLGIPCVNGLQMLVAQAKKASEYFSNTILPDNLIETIHKHLEAEMKNIILIGMPGCGKSSVGQVLAEKTGRKLIDTDDIIPILAEKSIQRILSEDGEAVFRQWETKAIQDVSKESGCIIATGGGCVTQDRNYPLLHQNGTIFWLQREIEKLPTEGRPLSKANGLKALYHSRKPMYEKFCDYAIDNNGQIEETIRIIIHQLEG